MFFKVALLVLASIALNEASYQRGYSPIYYSAQNSAESTDDKYAINTDKTQDSDWGRSKTKKIGFANQYRDDQSAKTDDVVLKKGPSYGGYGGYAGYGGYGNYGGYGGQGYGKYRPQVPYDGGLEYSSSKKDIRSSKDGNTKYDAVDDAREHNKKSAADRGKIYVDRHGRKGYQYIKAANQGQGYY